MKYCPGKILNKICQVDIWIAICRFGLKAQPNNLISKMYVWLCIAIKLLVVFYGLTRMYNLLLLLAKHAVRSKTFKIICLLGNSFKNVRPSRHSTWLWYNNQVFHFNNNS